MPHSAAPSASCSSAEKIARFCIFAGAASCQGFDAYTCTDGHVCCDGARKPTDMVGIETAPDTLRVMSSLVLSTVMATVDQELSGWLWVGVINFWLVNPFPDETILTYSPRVG